MPRVKQTWARQQHFRVENCQLDTTDKNASIHTRKLVKGLGVRSVGNTSS